MFCLNHGTRDAEGNWPFGPGLRALDDKKKSNCAENSSREQFASQSSKRDTRFSRSAAAESGPEATSPLKGNDGRKRKGGGVLKEYRKVN
jgi:hypothetical protein